MKKIVTLYFNAWKNLESQQLRDVFTNDVAYTFQSLRFNIPSDTLEYRGIDRIEQYWQRNKCRQKDLRVRHIVFQLQENSASAFFQASFTDRELKEAHTVYGVAHFLRRPGDALISSLSEHYILDSRSAFRATAISTLQRIPWVFGALYRLISRIRYSALLRIAFYFVVFSYTLSLSAYLFFGLFGIPDAFARVWEAVSNESSVQSLQDTKELLMKELRQWMPWILTAFSPLIPLLYFLRGLFVNKKLPLYTVSLRKVDQDLDIMTRYFKHAERLIILSGDYSFLGRSPILCETLRRLSRRNHIKVLSYKSEDEVQKAMSVSLQAQNLFESLTTRRQIFFDCPVHAKTSYVSYGGSKSLLLYRYKVDDGGENEYRMAFVRGHPKTDYLLTFLGAIFEQLAGGTIKET